MTSAADVWEKVKSLMENTMTAVSIETWFGDVEAVALEDTRLVLCVPTDFKRSIIRSRFQSGVEGALRELFSFDVDVALLLPEERDAYAHQAAAPSHAGGGRPLHLRALRGGLHQPLRLHRRPEGGGGAGGSL